MDKDKILKQVVRLKTNFRKWILIKDELKCYFPRYDYLSEKNKKRFKVEILESIEHEYKDTRELIYKFNWYVENCSAVVNLLPILDEIIESINNSIIDELSKVQGRKYTLFFWNKERYISLTVRREI